MFEFQDGLLYCDGLLYGPNGLAWFQVIQVRHDVLVVKDFGFNKTMELMFRNYWWPQFWKYVKEFVGSYDVCVQAKNSWHRPHGLFQPLPIHASSWSLISMDFIIDLSPFSSYDSILVMVYCLMSMDHFIPCTKTIICKRIAKLFLDHVFRYQGILENIIFDHRLQFESKFWKQLFELLGVKVKLSSTFHPQMDGQTK